MNNIQCYNDRIIFKEKKGIFRKKYTDREIMLMNVKNVLKAVENEELISISFFLTNDEEINFPVAEYLNVSDVLKIILENRDNYTYIIEEFDINTCESKRI